MGQALEPFKDQLLLDITPEGLRIQIVDKQNRPMFDTGSSALKDYTTQILRGAGQVSERSAQPDQPSGHTDASRMPGPPALLELGTVGGPRERGAARAHGRRPGPQRLHGSSGCPPRYCSSRTTAQSDQPPHQHHRHDPTCRRCGALDRCPVARHHGSRRTEPGRFKLTESGTRRHAARAVEQELIRMLAHRRSPACGREAVALAGAGWMNWRFLRPSHAAGPSPLAGMPAICGGEHEVFLDACVPAANDQCASAMRVRTFPRAPIGRIFEQNNLSAIMHTELADL